MEIQLPDKLARGLAHEARRRRTTLENLVVTELEHRLAALRMQSVRGGPQPQFNFEAFLWQDLARVTGDLLRFCEEHRCEDTASVQAIRQCLLAAERQDAGVFKAHLAALDLHPKGRLLDWLPVPPGERHGSGYLGTVFHAVLAYWLNLAHGVIGQTAPEDPDSPGSGPAV